MDATPKRRWYQFSLKAMLVGMTVLCIGPGGYVAYEQAKARKQKAAVEAIEKSGGYVEFYRDVPIRSAMIRQILGDESFGNVRLVVFDGSEVSDADLAPISGLKSLQELSLRNTGVTSGCMQHLVGLKSLRFLWLDDTQVSDAGLEYLTGLKDLTHVGFDNSKVTVAAVAQLRKALPNCRIDARQEKEHEFSPSELELTVELPGKMMTDWPAPAPIPPTK